MAFSRTDSAVVPRPGEGRSCAPESCAPRAVHSVGKAVDTGCGFGQQLHHPGRYGGATTSRLRDRASPPQASAWRLTLAQCIFDAAHFWTSTTRAGPRVSVPSFLVTFPFYSVHLQRLLKGSRPAFAFSHSTPRHCGCRAVRMVCKKKLFVCVLRRIPPFGTATCQRMPLDRASGLLKGNVGGCSVPGLRDRQVRSQKIVTCTLRGNVNHLTSCPQCPNVCS